MAETSAATGNTAVPPGAERRASVRYYFTSDAGGQPSATGADSRWTARVRDLSATGVGLLCDRAFDGGRLLRVELQAIRTKAVLTLEVCVVRSLKQAGGDWLVGAAFIEKLSEDQLRTMLEK